jgi:MFS family permease
MSAAAPSRTTPIRSWVALFALSLPMFVLSIDANGVVVLLPTIGKDLGVGVDTMSAVVTVSSLAFAAPLVLIGRIADRVGARPLLLGGVVGFAVASTICAVTESYSLLLVGRGLQGIASACCFATSLAAIDALFDAKRLPVAIGIWGAIGGVGSAAGPLVASVIGDVWSWRWFFAINVVLLSIAFVMLWVLVPHLPGDRTRSIPYGRLLVLAFGIWTISGAIQHAGVAGWWNAAVLGSLAVGAVALALLVRRPRGRTRADETRAAEPLVDRDVTRNPSFRLGVAEATLSNWGSGVIMVLVPSALQAVRGLDLLDTGLVFLAFSVPFAVGGALSGPLTHRLGARATQALGSAGLAVGLTWLAVSGVDGALWIVGVGLAVAGLGNGIVYSASTSYSLSELPVVDAAEASAVLNMVRVLGLALGIALSNSIVRVVDGSMSGDAQAGLRVALGVAAVIAVVGVPIARTTGRRVAASAPDRH